MYGQLISNKCRKTVQWGHDSFFNTWCWKNGRSTHQNKQKTLDPITIKKLTQSGLRSNCKSQNFKISEEYTGETQSDSRFGKDFLNMTQNAPTIKKNQWIELHQNKKTLLFKRCFNKNEKVNHKLREKICKTYKTFS